MLNVVSVIVLDSNNTPCELRVYDDNDEGNQKAEEDFVNTLYRLGPNEYDLHALEEYLDDGYCELHQYTVFILHNTPLNN